MAIPLKYNTADQEIPLGYFVDSGDGNAEETALTIANTDIKLWKNGATTLANKNSGGATHISNGIYYAVLDATDTNTLGSLVVFVHVSGALAVRVECVVLPAVVYDSLIANTDKLQVDAVEVSGTTQTARDIGASVLLSPGTGTGQISLTSGAVTAGTVNDKTGYTASTVSDKTGYGLADSAVDAAKVTAAAANKIADHIIRRSFQSACDSTDGDTKGFRSLLGAIAKLVNKVAPNASNIQIFEDDDTTVLGTQAVTTSPSAEPITALDTT